MWGLIESTRRFFFIRRKAIDSAIVNFASTGTVFQRLNKNKIILYTVIRNLNVMNNLVFNVITNYNVIQFMCLNNNYKLPFNGMNNLTFKRFKKLFDISV